MEHRHPADPGFWAEIVSVSAYGVVLGLSGEVDVCNQHELDAALSAMMATKVRDALIDASDCTFISLQGYAAIGRCSSELDSLTLRTWLPVARKALHLLGFDGIACVPAHYPCSSCIKERGEGPRKAERGNVPPLRGPGGRLGSKGFGHLAAGYPKLAQGVPTHRGSAI